MSKRKTDSYLISEALPQRQRIHKLMEKLDTLKDANAHLEELIEEVKRGDGTFDDILETVFQYQALASEDRRTINCEKNAKFTIQGAFENFNFTAPNLKKIDLRLINELRSYRFVDEHKNILIVGSLGVGKSHIACALGREAIEKGIDTRCMTLEDVVKEVTNTIESKKGRDQRIKSFVKTKLLILDDGRKAQ